MSILKIKKKRESFVYNSSNLICHLKFLRLDTRVDLKGQCPTNCDFLVNSPSFFSLGAPMTSGPCWSVNRETFFRKKKTKKWGVGRLYFWDGAGAKGSILSAIYINMVRCVL